MDVTAGDHGVGRLGRIVSVMVGSASPRRPRPIMTAVLLFIGTPLSILGLALMQRAEQR